MNKNLMAVIAATTMTTSMAAVDFSANYEGTLTDGGAATYAQDLDLKMVGSAGNSSVTVLMEDLTGGSTVTANQAWIETSLEGLAFKGGNYKSQNGSGLLQKKGAVTNQMEIGTSIAGAGLTVTQASGDGNATVNASTSIAGVDVNVQNVSATDRFITVVADFFGFGVTAETQETATGRNTAVAASAGVALSESTVVGLTGVYVDVKDTAGVTQDDGILGDISGANTGSTIKGAVASLNTDLGNVTGKYAVVNDLNTITAELQRGVWTLGHSKTENADGVTTAKINVAF